MGLRLIPERRTTLEKWCWFGRGERYSRRTVAGVEVAEVTKREGWIREMDMTDPPSLIPDPLGGLQVVFAMDPTTGRPEA